MVLVGNMQTGGAINNIGVSTGGWSGVGMDVSGSLQQELDEVMKNLTEKLTSAINHTLDATKSLDTVLGLAGDAAEALLGGDTNASVSLLQTHGLGPEDALPGLITSSLNTVMDTLIDKVVDGLDLLMEKLKPALLKAGELIQKFGDKIMNIIESFSVTLDKAQKMFDQVMSQISGGEDMEERLLHETYGIFDVSSSGAVTAQDLKYTASLYNIPCLMGAKAEELVEKYDEDGSKDLDKKEFQMMCHDEALPDIMSVVLRSFAKTLTEVAGNVGASKFRGEIADHVVEYITLMAAKNMTKVGWISDALGNASLPIEFTSDVFVKLALQLDDPNTHLELRTGEIFINTIMGLHPHHTAKAVDLISNSTYWLSEGFAPDDHGTVIERVTEWFTKAQKDSPSAFLQTMRQLSGSEESGMDGLVSVDADGSVHVEKSVLDIMPKVARRMAELNTRSRMLELDQGFTDRYEKLFASKTSRYLLLHLNGGQIAADKADDSSSAASRAIKTGVPAKPETLLFAKFLSWNATNTANRFQQYCFDATQTSSNAIDGFATQIQSMIKKIQSFIKMMKKYSTPEGIEHLENKFADFAKNAATDLLKTVKKSVGDLVNKSAPMLTTGLRDAIESTGMELGHTIAEVIASPLGKGLGPAIGHILGTLVGKEQGDKIADHIANYFSEDISDNVGDLLGKQITGLLNNLVDEALMKIEDSLTAISDKVGGKGHSLLQMSTESLLVGKVATSGPEEEELLAHLDRKLGAVIRKTQAVLKDAIEAGVQARKEAGITDHHLAFHRAHLDGRAELETSASNAISTIVSQIQSLRNMLPLASKTIIFARTEVSKLAKNLDSIFETFADKGPPIFKQVAGMWNMAFQLYFFVMLLFPLIMLYYAFWAGGWFGGPGTLPEPLEAEVAKQEKGCCATVCDACCNCWIMYHDTTLCFWSCCIFLQVITLMLFLISLLFCILAAVQIFLGAGCQQIYMLGDGSVCGNTLLNLRKFLASFLPGVHDDHMPGACHDKSLLLGQLIGSAMQNAAMMTVIGSMVASGATFQMIIESATLHSRAVVRREIADILQQEDSTK
jgi:hypothetical protein